MDEVTKKRGLCNKLSYHPVASEYREGYRIRATSPSLAASASTSERLTSQRNDLKKRPLIKKNYHRKSSIARTDNEEKPKLKYIFHLK